jgi:hypothetical protein
MENVKKVKLMLIIVYSLYTDTAHIRTRLPVSVVFRFCRKPDELSRYLRYTHTGVPTLLLFVSFQNGNHGTYVIYRNRQ